MDWLNWFIEKERTGGVIILPLQRHERTQVRKGWLSSELVMIIGREWQARAAGPH